MYKTAVLYDMNNGLSLEFRRSDSHFINIRLINPLASCFKTLQSTKAIKQLTVAMGFIWSATISALADAALASSPC
jgi:hypothetical protein